MRKDCLSSSGQRDRRSCYHFRSRPHHARGDLRGDGDDGDDRHDGDDDHLLRDSGDENCAAETGPHRRLLKRREVHFETDLSGFLENLDCLRGLPRNVAKCFRDRAVRNYSSTMHCSASAAVAPVGAQMQCHPARFRLCFSMTEKNRLHSIITSSIRTYHQILTSLLAFSVSIAITLPSSASKSIIPPRLF